jgi:hypothetical protein
MDVDKQIDTCEYLYLRGISEPETNVLQLIFEEGKTSTEATDLDLGRTTLKGLYEIYTDATCRLFEIIFPTYITYAVRNESYATTGDDEEFTGRRFRTYTTSSFLEYMGAATWASEEYPGPFAHYGIIASHHLVDVISVERPSITVLRGG